MNPTSTRTRTIIAALAVTLAFVAAGCGSSGGSDSSKTGGGDTATSAANGTPKLDGKVNDEGTKDISGDGADVTLSMKLADNSFSPTFVKAEPGATVTVKLANVGANPHTFTLDDGSVDQQVDPGKSATVTVTVPKDGTLRFSCNFHGAMGMQGAFYTGAAASGNDVTTTEASSRGSGY
jgi:plastocyanin